MARPKPKAKAKVFLSKVAAKMPMKAMPMKADMHDTMHGKGTPSKKSTAVRRPR